MYISESAPIYVIYKSAAKNVNSIAHLDKTNKAIIMYQGIKKQR